MKIFFSIFFFSILSSHAFCSANYNENNLKIKQPPTVAALSEKQYTKFQNILKIPDFHRKGITGNGQKIAVMDVLDHPDDKIPNLPTFFNQPINNDKVGSQHSQKMMLVIAGNIKTPLNKSSYAPDVQLSLCKPKWYWSRSKSYFSPDAPKLIFKCRTPEGHARRVVFENGTQISVASFTKGWFIEDVIHRDQKTDIQMAKYIKQCIADNYLIMNISRDLLFGPETLKAMKEFAKKGGVFVKSIGNDFCKHTKKGIEILTDKKPRLAYLDAHLHCVLRQAENRDIRNAFVFASGFRFLNSNKIDTSYSCLPSDSIADISIALPLEHKTELFTATGTSTSAAILSSIIALTKERIEKELQPSITPQQVSRVLLKHARQIKSQFFGRGVASIFYAFKGFSKAKAEKVIRKRARVRILKKPKWKRKENLST